METDTTYTPPELIAEVDDDVIHARMLENLPDDIDKTDGGFAHDFTRPAALEKAELLVALNDAIQVFSRNGATADIWTSWLRARALCAGRLRQHREN